MTTVWTVNWPHGKFDVHAKGGMLAGVKLNVGGQDVAPFYEAPWIAPGIKADPPILENLRSEFPCVPFGADYPQESVTEEWKPSLRRSDADAQLDATDFLLHGYCTVADWRLVHRDEESVEIEVEYPETSAIRRLARKVSADRNGPHLTFSLTIETRRPVVRPIGLHPNFALPQLSGAFRIKPGAFKFGIVHAAGPEPGVSRALPGAIFEDLASVPLSAGGTAAFDQLPFAHDTEEIVELCGIDGRVELIDETRAVLYRLSWDPGDFNSLLLWMSNRGRAYAPWNGKNLCVGVEPLTGAFDLGTRASLASNPINRRGVATTVELDPASPRTVEYRFSAAPAA
ncbi:hypothetical protein [Mesorhizobium sp. BH1-1-4]|uniref:hypothetical protein n=1 Tax=Mesorhizobium sp. BH1-1-4 TaxID=2876662 RepID=UPI001CD1768E|nr:hypothetical protein [Mesorhizobium sp. BH1-1-4]MBZ9994333.1 hypothetical protein [Mesorhizobium sp. BH1-1-4]